jgi:hypothetical protein
MMHTRNCKTLHDYLNKDQFDIALLYNMVKEYFGHDLVLSTEEMLELYYNREITNLRQYFALVDARVAEYY